MGKQSMLDVKKQAVGWDFTLSKEYYEGSVEELKILLKSIAKKWVFQLEKTEDGYVHYQGRVSLHTKMTGVGFWNEIKEVAGLNKMSWSVTYTETHRTNNFNYVMKDLTRIEGPWTDKDKDEYIPVHYRNIEFKQWQKDAMVVMEQDKGNDRTINCIIDTKGNTGKSTWAALMELRHGGIDLPPINDSKELLQMLCDICSDGELRSPSPICIDIPRAVEKKHLKAIYAGCEQIKKGKLYDPRHHFKKWWIDTPSVWVFTNEEPNCEWVSRDRWRFYKIEGNRLMKHVIEEE